MYLPLVASPWFNVPVTWGVVAHIVDGDTFDLETTERIRPIGIDTPERGECYYTEASDRARALLLGQPVALERDHSETDRYDRLLRYVYLRDGSWFNGVMVAEGYAIAKRYPPDTRYAVQLEALQAQAQAERLGGWGACGW